MTPTLPLFGGQMIWKANPEVVKVLQESGALFSKADFVHSYMHCWRHKTPVILRATTQWFAGMDDVPGWRGRKPTETLRTTALRGIVSGRSPPDASEFLVGSQRVSVSAATKVLPANRSLADVVNGADVEVQGTIANGVLTASRIQLR